MSEQEINRKALEEFTVRTRILNEMYEAESEQSHKANQTVVSELTQEQAWQLKQSQNPSNNLSAMDEEKVAGVNLVEHPHLLEEVLGIAPDSLNMNQLQDVNEVESQNIPDAREHGNVRGR